MHRNDHALQLVVTSELTTQELYNLLGRYCLPFEDLVLTNMRQVLGSGYRNGAYQLRRYFNGAFALVLPVEDGLVMATLGQVEESLSLEAASYLCSLLALSQLITVAHSRNDHDDHSRLHYLYYGLLEVLRADPTFAATATAPHHRPLTDEEICIGGSLAPFACQPALERLLD